MVLVNSHLQRIFVTAWPHWLPEHIPVHGRDDVHARYFRVSAPVAQCGIGEHLCVFQLEAHCAGRHFRVCPGRGHVFDRANRAPATLVILLDKLRQTLLVPSQFSG